MSAMSAAPTATATINTTDVLLLSLDEDDCWPVGGCVTFDGGPDASGTVSDTLVAGLMVAVAATVVFFVDEVLVEDADVDACAQYGSCFKSKDDTHEIVRLTLAPLSGVHVYLKDAVMIRSPRYSTLRDAVCTTAVPGAGSLGSFHAVHSMKYQGEPGVKCITEDVAQVQEVGLVFATLGKAPHRGDDVEVSRVNVRQIDVGKASEKE